MTILVTGPITVVAHKVLVKDGIGNINGFRSLVPRSLLMETHADTVTRKSRAICGCLILEKHAICIVNSPGVHIGRLSKDVTIL